LRWSPTDSYELKPAPQESRSIDLVTRNFSKPHKVIINSMALCAQKRLIKKTCLF
jgi:hypothetical protein